MFVYEGFDCFFFVGYKFEYFIIDYLGKFKVFSYLLV